MRTKLVLKVTILLPPSLKCEGCMHMSYHLACFWFLFATTGDWRCCIWHDRRRKKMLSVYTQHKQPGEQFSWIPSCQNMEQNAFLYSTSAGFWWGVEHMGMSALICLLRVQPSQQASSPRISEPKDRAAFWKAEPQILAYSCLFWALMQLLWKLRKEAILKHTPLSKMTL